MRFTIKKNKHRALPITVGFFFNRTTIRKIVTFGEGCNYWIEGPDMMDTNKLFGIGFFWNHHKESARFGWRYDNAAKIVLSAYCYVNGERVIKDLCKVPRFTKITCALYVQKDFYQFDVLIEGTPIWSEQIAKYHKKKFAFPLGLYFGGNVKSPNDIHVEMKKL